MVILDSPRSVQSGQGKVRGVHTDDHKDWVEPKP